MAWKVGMGFLGVNFWSRGVFLVLLEAPGNFLGFHFSTTRSTPSLEIQSTAPWGRGFSLSDSVQPLFLPQIPLSPTPSNNRNSA